MKPTESLDENEKYKDREFYRQGFTISQYNSMHSSLRKHKKSGLCCECGLKFNRTHWALKKGETYSYNISSYQEMCASCHLKMDCTDEYREKARLRGKEQVKNKPTWGTNSIGKFGGLHATSVGVVQLNIDGSFIKEWGSISEAVRHYNLSGPCVISAVATGRKKSCHGFKWVHSKNYKK